MTISHATVLPLRERPEHCALLSAAFEAEWPSWYGPDGPGDAHADLRAFADRGGGLPVGVVALGPGNEPLGVAALKAMSIPTHAHLTPWAAAGYVLPVWRRHGIGAMLLAALLAEAGRLGYNAVYCATASSGSLLVRQGWRFLESVVHDGQSLQVFEMSLLLEDER